MFLTHISLSLAFIGLSSTLQEPNITSNAERRLYAELFVDYNKNVRPLKDPKRALKVWINPSISGITKADEIDQSLKFFQWFPMVWHDEHLEWDPMNYDGLTYFLVPSELIWVPDIFAFTTMEAKETMPLDKTIARIDHTGNVMIVKHQFLTVRCQYHILLFPFDVQKCRMPFGSWAYTAEQVQVESYESGLGQQIFEENSEWEIVAFSATKETVSYGSFSHIVNRTFQEVHYELVFKRKPTFYIYMIVVPCSFMVNICLLGMFAPFNTVGERHEKLTLGLTTLLTVAVLLHIVSGEMPKSAEGLPLLGKFILGELIVCASAVTSTVVLMYAHRQVIKRRCTPPFRWKALRSLIKYHNSIEFNEPFILANEKKSSTKWDTTTSDLQGVILKSCVEHVNAMKSQFWHFQRDLLLHEIWNAIFEWLDLILLLFFFLVNVVFSFIMFMIVPDV